MAEERRVFDSVLDCKASQVSYVPHSGTFLFLKERCGYNSIKLLSASLQRTSAVPSLQGNKSSFELSMGGSGDAPTPPATGVTGRNGDVLVTVLERNREQTRTRW